LVVGKDGDTVSDDGASDATRSHFPVNPSHMKKFLRPVIGFTLDRVSPAVYVFPSEEQVLVPQVVGVHFTAASASPWGMLVTATASSEARARVRARLRMFTVVPNPARRCSLPASGVGA